MALSNKKIFFLHIVRIVLENVNVSRRSNTFTRNVVTKVIFIQHPIWCACQLKKQKKSFSVFFFSAYYWFFSVGLKCLGPPRKRCKTLPFVLILKISGSKKSHCPNVQICKRSYRECTLWCYKLKVYYWSHRFGGVSGEFDKSEKSTVH